MDDATFGRIFDAFQEHSVLVFRDQVLTDEQQMAFSRRLGPLEVALQPSGRSGGCTRTSSICRTSTRSRRSPHGLERSATIATSWPRPVRQGERPADLFDLRIAADEARQPPGGRDMQSASQGALAPVST